MTQDNKANYVEMTLDDFKELIDVGAAVEVANVFNDKNDLVMCAALISIIGMMSSKHVDTDEQLKANILAVATAAYWAGKHKFDQQARDKKH